MRGFLGGKRNFEAIDSSQMDHLRVFHDVARTLTSSLELDEILHTIMNKMAAFFGPERWSLMMVDESTSELYYAIAVGENEQTLKGLRVPLGEGVAGWVAATGNTLVVPDVSLDPHWLAFSAESSRPQYPVDRLSSRTREQPYPRRHPAFEQQARPDE